MDKDDPPTEQKEEPPTNWKEEPSTKQKQETPTKWKEEPLVKVRTRKESKKIVKSYSGNIIQMASHTRFKPSDI